MIDSPSLRPGHPDNNGRRSTVRIQYEIIKQRILSGALDPQITLYETALSKELGVSRTPVREALRMLEQDGLLVRRARGYNLKISTPADILAIYEVRIALETAAAAAAAERRTELDLVQLRNQQANAQKRVATNSRKASADFHRLVWMASHNPILIELLENIDTRVRALDRPPLAAPVKRTTTLKEHQLIIDAIHQQQPGSASAAMRTHLQRTRDLRLDAIATNLN